MTTNCPSIEGRALRTQKAAHATARAGRNACGAGGRRQAKTFCWLPVRLGVRPLCLWRTPTHVAAVAGAQAVAKHSAQREPQTTLSPSAHISHVSFGVNSRRMLALGCGATIFLKPEDTDNAGVIAAEQRDVRLQRSGSFIHFDMPLERHGWNVGIAVTYHFVRDARDARLKNFTRNTAATTGVDVLARALSRHITRSCLRHRAACASRSMTPPLLGTPTGDVDSATSARRRLGQEKLHNTPGGFT